MELDYNAILLYFFYTYCNRKYIFIHLRVRLILCNTDNKIIIQSTK